VRRREFIKLVAGAAAGWPLAARAQRAGKVARIGFLGATSASDYVNRLEAFRSGLRELGYIEGTNVVITYRWAEGNYERLPELVAELLRSKVDVVVTHGTPASLAAKKASTTIPIVMAIIGDPIASGVVASLARPGGNITGSSFFSHEVEAKRVELLKEAMPHLNQIGILSNPDNASSGPELREMETVARTIKVGLQQFLVREPGDFNDVFERMEQGHVEAVVTQDDAVLIANIQVLAALMLKRRLPSIGATELAPAGGLMGYGVDFVASYRRAAALVDKILKGTSPADIPIERTTKFVSVLNLKTAKALGIIMPTSILLRADEVIE
jgi:putative tryptophan/tyrosine transport system substrate-binding protein